MNRRRILCLALAAVALTLGLVVLLPPSPGVTAANFERVQMGMTLAEVDALMTREGTEGTGDHRTTLAIWYTRSGTVCGRIIFERDAKGEWRVMRKDWSEPPDTLLDRLVARFYRQ
jgi:hypothetical protein